MRANLVNVSTSELSWREPLASQAISDNFILIQRLPKQFPEIFMKPVEDMIPPTPTIIREKCNKFESDNILAEVAENILDTLNIVWDNPAFGPDFVKSLNESTYVTNVIVKDLPFGRMAFIERQSTASADR
ncbi:9916_t:CDS:2 [Ambispora leptoticha]|uniref:9916_t:CDS:1 n=1 Tax=Ambispora leptoticha TaxID=144679 RepID=A0A9N9GEK1_9GLOM|nr:9916_t:CDS:2 [Ambispora leptoticha]